MCDNNNDNMDDDEQIGDGVNLKERSGESKSNVGRPETGYEEGGKADNMIEGDDQNQGHDHDVNGNGITDEMDQANNAKISKKPMK
jgi:hypothetical protein